MENNITTPDNLTSTCIQNLKLQREWANNYLINIEDSLVQCPTILPTPTQNVTSSVGIANVSNYANISNLNNTNWIFGNTTQAEYYLNLFKFMTSNNVTNCPASAPYVLNGTKNCSQCSGATPLFDISQAKCVACPDFYIFNSTTHTCGLNFTCPEGFFFDETTQKCQCNPSNPFFNGTACFSCYFPNFWNTNTLSCDSCPAGYINVNTVCVLCPADKPNVVGFKCEACNISEYFNQDTKQCEKCAAPTAYNYTSKQCECPSEAPLLVNTASGPVCSSCPFLTFYNQTTKSCEACAAGLTFNATSKTCYACPSDKPISNGFSCTGCTAPGSFYN